MRSAAGFARRMRPRRSALTMASTEESMMRCRKSFVFRSSCSTARSAVTSRKVQRVTPSSRMTELKLTLRMAMSPPFFRDVTAERAVEQELLKTKDFLQRIIDSSVDAIVSADLRGRILLANPAAERIYGIPVHQLIGQNLRSRYPEGVAQDVMRLIRVGGGRVENLRADLLNAAGERVPVSLSAALIYEGEVPVGSVGIFTDLREKVRMEQRLAQAQEQLLAQERQAIVAELAGAAAHELRHDDERDGLRRAAQAPLGSRYTRL